MNFVKAETLIQEITADGKIRDIVTQCRQTEAEKEAQRKEDVIRSLPEFKRERNAKEGKLDNPNFAEETDKDRKAEDAKQYAVHTIDEEEGEHYQMLQDKELARVRKRQTEDAEALSTYESERKRFKEEAEDKASSGADLSAIKRQTQEKLAARAKATPTAADRMKASGFVVKKAGAPSAATVEAPSAAAVSGGGGLLAGYGSDSDE
ncbi:unnamed protein product [Polarella glacialis]|uniref:Uncharacterized protein n=1 Tax=Polarella glacialis TaxID=89957 RepID=A0A813L823_POLGL|nr:unnamed protein product [Polarella glacialis]CAE8721129.1 unnamed protein product [Polarella glacialis]|mmetsp:Transcript_72398/g.116757  ORF Transcript_72398/g.116757 Transcript_72398/m.116757 type:complete len:207 (+) Transcript_72398:101-721(+)